MGESKQSIVKASRVHDAEGIAACQEVMRRVFREELGFCAMKFPVDLKRTGENNCGPMILKLE